MKLQKKTLITHHHLHITSHKIFDIIFNFSFRPCNKSQVKTLSPNINLYENSINNKLVQNSNTKKEINQNPYKNSKTLIQYQKHLIGNKETSKTLYDFEKLPLNKMKKTNTLKSQTSRPEKYQPIEITHSIIPENCNIYKNQNNHNHNRAKSALRYKPQYPDYNYNHSFHNLEMCNPEAIGFNFPQKDPNHSENYQNSEEFLNKYKQPNKYS